MWTRDGEEIVFWSGLDMASVAVATEPEFTHATPQVLYRRAFRGDAEVTADGERFLELKAADAGGLVEASTPRINVVLNWFEELKQRVPTGGR